MEMEDQDRDIANGDAVVVNMENALEKIRKRPKTEEPFKIFRVPPQYREANKRLYEPQIVSIGPYYHGIVPLRTMEQNKLWYLDKLLSRNSNKPLKDYVLQLTALEARARRCYVDSFDLDHDQFVKMLLLDGCFIIELVLLWRYCETDVMRHASWTFCCIISDLKLMENQIPFFVLKALFRLVMGPDDTTNLISLFARFFRYGAPTQSITEVRHLLHLSYSYVVRTSEFGNSDGGGGGSSNPIASVISSLRSCAGPARRFRDEIPDGIPDAVGLRGADDRFKKKRTELGKSDGGGGGCSNPIASVISSLRSYVRPATRAIPDEIPDAIPCAMELREAGVQFKRKRTANLLDITFWKGTIEIPRIKLDDNRTSEIMNLVGFEQGIDLEEKPMAAFAFFMDCIINTAEDVAILEECGVLEHCIGSRKEVALFVNQIGQCVSMDPTDHYLAGMFREVNQYCRSSWPKYRAKLNREYFSNPWAILSLIAALVLLALTFLQTFFAIYAYFRPLSPSPSPSPS